MKKYIKPTMVFRDISLSLMDNTVSGSNMPWEAKKQYIPPCIDISEIEDDGDLMQASAHGSDMPSDGPWDSKAGCSGFEDEEGSFNWDDPYKIDM